MVSALNKLLRPIIRILIRADFSFRDFNEVAKLAYVDEASRNYGMRGRLTNVSRVALMTGLTRREVARLRKILSIEELSLSAPTITARVVGEWPRCQGFQGELKPAQLPLEGPGSLASLIDSLRCDVPSTTVVKELCRSEIISITDGSARLQVTAAEHGCQEALELVRLARARDEGSASGQCRSQTAHLAAFTQSGINSRPATVSSR